MTATPYRWVMTAPDRPMEKVEFDPFPPAEGEVVVEVAGCGVCHTDLGYMYDGVRTGHELPLALGHEISGRVVATGAGAGDWRDRAVLVPAVFPCGACDLCRRGKFRICRRQAMPGNDIQGGFASHIVVPGKGLCPVNEARLAAAGLTLADISVVADAVTTPYQAVVGSGLGEGDLAVVVGVGGVGGYTVQVANALGATVIAIDIDGAKLEAIAEHGGAAHTINAGEVEGREFRKQVTAFAREQGLRTTEWIIFECSGTTAGQQTAYGLLTFGATLCVIGFTRERAEFRLSNLMAFDARAIGNWGCSPDRYPEALDLVLDGKVNLLPFVEHHPLSEINEIFEAVHAHRLSRRAILVPGSEGESS